MTWEPKYGCSKVTGTLGISRGLADFPLYISEQSIALDPQPSLGAGEAYLWLPSSLDSLMTICGTCEAPVGF